MIAIGLGGFVTAWAFFGWRLGLGFALGALIAYVNFHWLKKVVAGIADLTVASGTPASSRGLVIRFLLRYFLMALVAFVILTVSRKSLYGLFAGLLLPVTALLCEAVHQLYGLFNRRSVHEP
jgi:hypothetical protein